MSSNRYPPSPAAMASRLGHHLLLSLGVTTAAALLAALPSLLSGATPEQRLSRGPAASATLATLATLQRGKIIDRLDGTPTAADVGIAAATPVVSAALAMPMSLSWPEAGAWAPAQLAILSERRGRAGEGASHPAAHRGAAQPLRTAAAAGPLVILPPAPASALEAATDGGVSRDDSSQDESWSRLVVVPTAKVVDAVSDAAGSVQAAGAWGLSRAASLLPRW